ncbi:hypothetical protein TNCV_2436001 [Trichonephila clavipes]|nr:hypothetical protein TNCV_2436001 [Trichonephila clavipes]
MYNRTEDGKDLEPTDSTSGLSYTPTLQRGPKLLTETKYIFGHGAQNLRLQGRGPNVLRYATGLDDVEFDKGRIIGMMEAGWSPRRVARQLGRSDSVVRRCWDQW